jgi:hypothetical protein
MPEVDKQLTFNASQMCMLVLLLNLIITGDLNYIINFINYLINIESPGFWFIIIHILLIFIMLNQLQFELGFRAAIKFNI